MATGIARLSLPYEDVLIKAGSLRNFEINGKVKGYQFEVASNGYRGTYLSCIEDISFKVDGEKVADEDFLFCINGKKFIPDQLPELYSEYWFTTAYAVIMVYKDGGLPPGEYTIEYSITTRIPFSGYFGDFESTSNTVKRTFAI